MLLSQYLQVDLRELNEDPTAMTIDRAQISVDTSDRSADKNIKALQHTGGLLLPEATKIYQLAIYMPTTVGNEANYRGRIAPSITFGIKVTASQVKHESDSFDNTYDEAAPEYVSVSNKKEFKRVFSDAKPGEDLYVLLEGDIDLESGFVRIIREKHNNQMGVGDGNVVINGNGHTITTKYAETLGAINVEYTDSARSITLVDTVIRSEAASASEGGERCGLKAFEMTNGTLNLIGCTIETENTQNGIGIKLCQSKNLTINLTDCKISAAVPIEFEGSSNCRLTLKNSDLESTINGKTIVETESTISYWIDPSKRRCSSCCLAPRAMLMRGSAGLCVKPRKPFYQKHSL